MQTKLATPRGLGQAEGTFPGNSGGNGWEGRGDHLISRDSASQSKAERVREWGGPWLVPRGQWLWVVTRGGSQAGRNLLFEKWRKPAGARDNSVFSVCLCASASAGEGDWSQAV